MIGIVAYWLSMMKMSAYWTGFITTGTFAGTGGTPCRWFSSVCAWA